MKGDVYLQIVEDDKGRPVMHFNGREFGVLEEPRIEFNSVPYGIYERRYRADVSVNIRAVLIEPEPAPPPKPKRTWARSMGLRRPRG
ncbi:hypothetical protein PBI_ACHEBE_36 [Mycobacterium phage Achebe]|uniref:Uncharacterized protein n=1 Tax=Mycobacterium phage Backyardigan TaxID=2902881 RepID=G1BL09_9CAUD|nr:hypothetical protein WILE_37 [Mycobacterium phage Wile]YP_009635449.1 hypothetical protein FGG52_gp36 [Mycobacterium phage Backyardigan]AOT27544.1 hypothetical protein SEA_BADGER_36 [Mycobacterium phage Badger]APD17385.1 hypothetical protein PBI_ACHEBE_36 [Mycobacterium phage Achebe]ASZ73670.1 hypothetical protein SEA_MORPHER26_37 [Mycobacterium phage Morpher26]AZS11649.1 hypothetical protein SEA_CICI_37 [Mycobacterium phage Cici]QAY05367.1 hypothetical protein SEA_KATALIE136_37 [Mycobacte